MTRKKCTKCKRTKQVDKFYKYDRAKDGRRYWCIACVSRERTRWRKDNRERRNTAERIGNLRRLGVNVTLEQIESLKKKQNNTCAICKTAPTARRNTTTMELAVDHDHETGLVRGLLCSQCNVAVGNFKDNIDHLRAAIKYLKKHAKSKTAFTRG